MPQGIFISEVGQMVRNPNPNTEGIIQYKKQESEQKKQSVLDALNELILLDDPERYPISKAEICRRAGVSKTFLYTYPMEILKPIDNAIKLQGQKLRVLAKKHIFSDNSKDKLIESLKRKIHALEKENKRLMAENAVLYGKLANK